MNRRLFLQSVAMSVAWTSLCQAQKPDRIPVVGILRAESDGQLAIEMDAYREALRRLGYIEGKSIRLEYRLVDSSPNSFEIAARQLVQSNVTIIFALGTPAALAARKATKTIPILLYVADPIGTGLVSSLARPGENITGVATMAEETGAKRIELLKELLPRATRFGVLANPDNPATARQLEVMQSAAKMLNVKLQVLEIRRVGDLERVLSASSNQAIEGLVTISDPILHGNQKLLAQHALKKKIPSITAFRGYAQAGGLISYGPDYRELLRRCAVYTDKILKGIRPADLPVEQPTKFELVLNQKTAKAIGLAIPESVLLRVDEVIR